MRKCIFISVLLACVHLGQVMPLQATGALFVRPFRSNQTYNLMHIKTYDAIATIQDQIAVTRVDQTFFNDSDDLVEATFIFPLPENAVITELYYWFNGKRYKASVREREEAQKAYNQSIRRYIDPALLQYLGDNLFKLNIAPINPKSEVRFEITYTELLDYEFGTVEYRFLLKTTGLSPRPLERISVQIQAKTHSRFKTFFSPTHQNSTATRIVQKAPDTYELVYGDENFLPDRDLIVRFETYRETVDINVITYTPTPEDSFGTDSFYALWITPPDSIAPAETIPRYIVFVADVSSSMEGERLEQLKAAMKSFLQALSEIDRFNIITFGTGVVLFKQDLVPANQENLNEAHRFINGLSALGLTNIDLALQSALQQSFADSTSNLIIFLTDGEPTWGETDPIKIVERATALNTRNIRIFPFGIGEDISRRLLISLARQNGGFATFIDAVDSISVVVGNYFQRISRPVLSNLQLDLGGLETYDRYPNRLFDLFWGSQVVQFGRYLNGGTYEIVLSGQLVNQSFTLKSTVQFADTLGGLRAVARLWARRKIDFLLEQIDIYGELDELVNAVIDLSIRFGILTRYTAFYSDPVTDIEKRVPAILPRTFVLRQNYPNPFNPETRIVFYVPAQAKAQRVRVVIYDVLGRLVRVLFDREVGPGRYEVVWDGTDALQRQVPSGTYIYKLIAGDVVLSKKMLLLR